MPHSSYGKKKSKLAPHQQEKFDLVMHEWGLGNLKSSSGQKVASQNQALAIAFSEAKKVK